MAYTNMHNFLEELSNQTKVPRTFSEYLIKKYGKDEETLPWSIWEAEVTWWAATYTREDKVEAAERLILLTSEEEWYAKLKGYIRLILKYDKTEKRLSPEEDELRNLLANKYPKLFKESSGYYQEYTTPVTNNKKSKPELLENIKKRVTSNEDQASLDSCKSSTLLNYRKEKTIRVKQVAVSSNNVPQPIEAPSYLDEAALLEY